MEKVTTLLRSVTEVRSLAKLVDLAYLGCYHKTPQTRWHINNLRTESPRFGCQHAWAH